MAENENRPSTRTVRSGGLSWEIIAQSSLIFAGITGVLFMIGWSYQSGWYGYFGVSMTQVNIPIQHIFIQSYVPLLVLLSTLGASMVIYSIGHSILVIVKAGGYKRAYLKSYGSFAREFSVSDWTGVLLIDSLLNYGVFSIIFDSPIRMYDLPMNAINEIIYSLVGVFASVLVTVLGLVILIGVILFYLSGVGYKELVKTIGFLLPIHPPRLMWVLGLLMVNIVISMSLSQRYGVITAAGGVEGFGGWKVQTVRLAYPGNIEAPDWMRLGCEQTTCLYGPFGLVAENSDSYILIPFTRTKGDYGAIASGGIFMIPKGNQVYLVPNDQRAILPPSPTSTSPGMSAPVTATATP